MPTLVLSIFPPLTIVMVGASFVVHGPTSVCDESLPKALSLMMELPYPPAPAPLKVAYRGVNRRNLKFTT
jgi:hypothetical protein